ncbi:hypothetical protein MMC32_004529 [Xylographa parallela]|nr:hypothetical protein [Xylographa parallela]
MEPRLSQSIYSLFRASRDRSHDARARFCAEHATKLRCGSITPRRFASSSLLWHFTGNAQKVDRQLLWTTTILRSHNGSAVKKQKNIQPEINGRFLSSPTAPERYSSVEKYMVHTWKDSQARQPYARPNIQNSSIRFASSSAVTAAAVKATGYEGIKDPSDITQNKYNQLADDYLEAVQQWLEDLSDADESVEVEFSVSESRLEISDTLVATAST